MESRGHHGRGPPKGGSGDSRGYKKRAAVAVGHSILVAACHILDRRQPYHDLGGDWFLQRYSNHAHVRRLVLQLERLGHKVKIEPAEAA